MPLFIYAIIIQLLWTTPEMFCTRTFTQNNRCHRPTLPTVLSPLRYPTGVFSALQLIILVMLNFISWSFAYYMLVHILPPSLNGLKLPLEYTQRHRLTHERPVQTSSMNDLALTQSALKSSKITPIRKIQCAATKQAIFYLPSPCTTVK